MRSSSITVVERMRGNSDRCEKCWFTIRFFLDVLAVLGADWKDNGLSECDNIGSQQSATFLGFQIVLELLYLTFIYEDAAIPFCSHNVLLDPSGAVQFHYSNCKTPQHQI